MSGIFIFISHVSILVGTRHFSISRPVNVIIVFRLFITYVLLHILFVHYVHKLKRCNDFVQDRTPGSHCARPPVVRKIVNSKLTVKTRTCFIHRFVHTLNKQDTRMLIAEFCRCIFEHWRELG